MPEITDQPVGSARRTLLIDLDGTLTDPKPGITNCIGHALERLGHPAPPADDLVWCIGPPLLDSFRKLLPGAGEEAAREALALYRERFGDVGIYENTLYEGAEAFLAAMQDQHRRMFLATTKPHVYAGPILAHFKLDGYFDGVYGSELDGVRADKRDLLGHLLAEQNLAGAGPCVRLAGGIGGPDAGHVTVDRKIGTVFLNPFPPWRGKVGMGGGDHTEVSKLGLPPCPSPSLGGEGTQDLRAAFISSPSHRLSWRNHFIAAGGACLRGARLADPAIPSRAGVLLNQFIISPPSAQPGARCRPI